jgi:integrase
LRAVLAVAYNFGLRKGELLGLRVSQVDLDVRTIHLLSGTTKNDKGHAIVMTEEVRRLVSDCINGKRSTDAVFTWPDGRPVTDCRRTWRSLTKRAGMPELIFHDLRRSAVRNMVRAEISKHVAKLISGHQTDSVFDRYDITDATDLLRQRANWKLGMGTPRFTNQQRSWFHAVSTVGL